MRKVLAALAALTVAAAMAPGATAGPSEGGYSSDNVEYVGFVPFEVGTATGARTFGNGKFLIVTSWKDFSIYDIKDPENPELLSKEPFGFKFENEDVATNGKIMLFSETIPSDDLHIYDIEDKTNPTLLATLEGAGDHTTDCILNCKWAYGSEGTISDLRDPANPKLMKTKWGEGTPAGNNGHDITEVAPGIVLTSTDPMMVLDARENPAKPELVAVAEQMQEFIHSNLWPRQGKDRWALSAGETWTSGAQARCTPNSAGFATWDTTNWEKTKLLRKVDVYRMEGGTYADGRPPSGTTFGCSTHWFDTHPDWKNGGIAAVAWYNYGTRFLKVDSKGKIEEVGWFVPIGGSTSATYWIDDEYLYSVDYNRGIDILRFTGKA